MITGRKVHLRVNGMQVRNVTLRHGEKKLEVVIADSLIGEFVIDEGFTLELLELVHPDEIRSGLPNGGWRTVSLGIFIALLRGGVIRVVGYP
jgi:hypothetical protein